MLHMGTSTDERGRLYLPKEVRERYGENYRVVQMPTHVALIPIDDDPLEGLREAVGDALEGKDIDELREGALTSAKADVEGEIADREQRAGDEE
jgi:bifunctional DNA-binding transcriptional regulator/antitoxin component of YhaV-PrlF toxin-antitoxin module